MRVIPCIAFCALTIYAMAQDTETKSQPNKAASAQTQATHETRKVDSEDIEQLQRDVQQLRVLVNQMRNNLAFVQSSQAPLKHQFELEADAWQVVIEQMDRRLKYIEHRNEASATPAAKP